MADNNETTIDQFVPDEVESAAYRVLAPLIPEMLLYYEGQNHNISPPYATLHVIDRRDVGNPEFHEVDSNGVQQIRQVIEGSLSVKVFGGAARRHLDNLRSRTKKQTSRDIMTRERFIIYATENVLDVQVRRGEVYAEPCSLLDMGFRFTQRFYDNVGLIEHVNVAGEFDTVPVSFDIDIKTP